MSGASRNDGQPPRLRTKFESNLPVFRHNNLRQLGQSLRVKLVYFFEQRQPVVAHPFIFHRLQTPSQKAVDGLGKRPVIKPGGLDVSSVIPSASESRRPCPGRPSTAPFPPLRQAIFRLPGRRFWPFADVKRPFNHGNRSAHHFSRDIASVAFNR